jgi:probable HAF family extracellular repeat protein
MRRSGFPLVTVLVALSICPCAVGDLTASFQGLGDLPDGAYESRAYGISADGRVVVGASQTVGGATAFRWEGGVMTSLGDLPGGSTGSYARAVSADGSVVAGDGQSASAMTNERFFAPSDG